MAPTTNKSLPRVFMSYRRREDPHFIGRIYDRLVAEFGIANVFRDVESIDGAENFLAAITKRLAESDIVLAIIGPQWSIGPPAHERDWVYVELERALERRMLVIPVCLDATPVPARSSLPISIQSLVDVNAMRMDGVNHFSEDMAELVRVIRTEVGARRAADAARQRPQPQRSWLDGPSASRNLLTAAVVVTAVAIAGVALAVATSRRAAAPATTAVSTTAVTSSASAGTTTTVAPTTVSMTAAAPATTTPVTTPAATTVPPTPPSSPPSTVALTTTTPSTVPPVPWSNQANAVCDSELPKVVQTIDRNSPQAYSELASIVSGMADQLGRLTSQPSTSTSAVSDLNTTADRYQYAQQLTALGQTNDASSIASEGFSYFKRALTTLRNGGASHCG
jgi:hypothetical protein